MNFYILRQFLLFLENRKQPSNHMKHYRKPILCRGLLGLRTAGSRALGKGSICRGPAPGALGKSRTSAKRPLPRARPSAKKRPSAKQIFAECLALGKYGRIGYGGHLRQSLPIAYRQALSKVFFIFLYILCRGPR
jgi:hypothetical protein